MSHCLSLANDCGHHSTEAAQQGVSSQPAEAHTSQSSEEEGPHLVYAKGMSVPECQHPSGDEGDWLSCTSSGSELSNSENEIPRLGRAEDSESKDSIAVQILVNPLKLALSKRFTSKSEVSREMEDQRVY